MEDDVIDELERKFHERDVEADGTARATASPSADCMRKPNFLIADSRVGRERCESLGQIRLRFFGAGLHALPREFCLGRL